MPGPETYAERRQKLTSVEAAAVAGLVFAVLSFASIIVTTSTLMLRTGVVYRWVAVVGYVIAAIMIVVPVLTRPAGLGLPLWVALVSSVLLVRKRQLTDAPAIASTDDEQKE